MTEPINLVQPHNCFGCGSLNLHGLRLQLFDDEETTGVWTEFTPDQRFEGYGGIVHGGIIATVLDEVMAWSCYRVGVWAVTATMNTRFRKPLHVGEATRASGFITENRGDRIYHLSGHIRRRSDDAVIAEATAVFMRVPEEQAQSWHARYITGEGA